MELIAQQSELPAVSAIPHKPVDPGDRHFWEYQKEGARVLAREAQARKAADGQAASSTDHVETGAFARPAQAKPSASVGTDALVRPAILSEAKGSVPTPAIGTTASVAPAAPIPPARSQNPAARPATKRPSSVASDTPTNSVPPQASRNRKTSSARAQDYSSRSKP